MEPTQRNYTNVETNKVFRLYMNEDRSKFELIYENPVDDLDLAKGTTVNGFYLAAHNSIDIKINNKKIVKIPAGYFYNLKENEVVTHQRYSGIQKQFKKAN